MIAVDDGIVSGNITFADLCFLVAVILAAAAAVLSFRHRPEGPQAAALGWLAVAVLSLGWFVL